MQGTAPQGRVTRIEVPFFPQEDFQCGPAALATVLNYWYGKAGTAKGLTPEEIATLFIDYRRKHQFFSRIVCRIPGWKWDSSYEEFLDLARTLRGVAFRPQ